MRSTGGPFPHDHDDRPVGAKLAGFRKRAGLTGHELAKMVGTTQSKISRLETGAVQPDPADVRRIAQRLELPASTVAQLVDEAEAEHNRMSDSRPGRAGLSDKQREVAAYERRSKALRLFNPTTVGGLMQTSNYAYAVMATAHRMMTGSARTASEAELLDAVAERIRRRETLLASKKRLFVVLSEAALANRVTSDEDMLQQVELLQELATSDRIDMRILPFETRLPHPAVHSFELFDDRWLGIDLFNTSLTSQGRQDIHYYRRLFEEMWEAATPDIDRILGDYARRYKSAG